MFTKKSLNCSRRSFPISIFFFLKTTKNSLGKIWVPHPLHSKMFLNSDRICKFEKMNAFVFCITQLNLQFSNRKFLSDYFWGCSSRCRFRFFFSWRLWPEIGDLRKKMHDFFPLSSKTWIFMYENHRWQVKNGGN